MKEQIKAWLKQFHHDREWLAAQLGVNKRTVDNWLSSPKDIPLGYQKHIERLMQEDEAAEALRRQKLQPQAQIFSLEVDLPTFRSYNAAALAAGCTLEQWAIHELNAAAEESMSTPAKPPYLYPLHNPGSTSIAAEEALADEQAILDLQAAMAAEADRIRQAGEQPPSSEPGDTSRTA